MCCQATHQWVESDIFLREAHLQKGRWNIGKKNYYSNEKPENQVAIQYLFSLERSLSPLFSERRKKSEKSITFHRKLFFFLLFASLKVNCCFGKYKFDSIKFLFLYTSLIDIELYHIWMIAFKSIADIHFLEFFFSELFQLVLKAKGGSLEEVTRSWLKNSFLMQDTFPEALKLPFSQLNWFFLENFSIYWIKT